uniref:Uncharacterized protein n=1 Tax=Panagrellus redivivus TaxID=6233 RepID=A0A7E4W6T5_PANRE
MRTSAKKIFVSLSPHKRGKKKNLFKVSQIVADLTKQEGSHSREGMKSVLHTYIFGGECWHSSIRRRSLEIATLARIHNNLTVSKNERKPSSSDMELDGVRETDMSNAMKAVYLKLVVAIDWLTVMPKASLFDCRVRKGIHKRHNKQPRRLF